MYQNMAILAVFVFFYSIFSAGLARNNECCFPRA